MYDIGYDMAPVGSDNTQYASYFGIQTTCACPCGMPTYTFSGFKQDDLSTPSGEHTSYVWPGFRKNVRHG